MKHKLEENDEQYMKDICAILCCYFEATKSFSASKYVSISIVLTTFDAILEVMKPEDDDCNFKTSLKLVLKHFTEVYFERYVQINLYIYTTVTFYIRTKMFSHVE